MRVSGQSLYLKDKPTGMMGNARDGSERWEENQVIASWKPSGENFQKACMVSNRHHMLSDADLLSARLSTFHAKCSPYVISFNSYRSSTREAPRFFLLTSLLEYNCFTLLC